MKKLLSVLSIGILAASCSSDDDAVDCNTTPPYECITYNGDKIPAQGETVKIYADTVAVTGTIAGGKGKVWNYTELEKQDSLEISFVDPSSTVNGSEFPASNLAANFGGSEVVFLASKSDGIEVLGIEIDLEGTALAMGFDDSYNLFDFPLDYGDEFSDDYFIEDTKYNLSFDFDGQNYNADSVYVKREGTISTKVDGCGKIKTPKGEYEVLRVYKEETVADTVIAYVFIGLGTFPVPIIQEVEVTRSYEFVTDSLNYPVATILLNEDKEAYEINYLD